jgi:ribosomal protein L3 glutamine methyltransferase
LSRVLTRPAAPRTVGELVDEGTRRFRAAGLQFGHGTAGARDEAVYLALHALKLPLDAGGQLARPVSPPQARRALRLFDRRIRTRKPAAYLTREAWLGDYRFYVDERVIIPRSHIAELLFERLAPWIPARQRVRSVLDLCTGSGCLAILAALAFPRARVDAADVSRAALAVARINVGRYRLGRRIRLVRSDLFSALQGKRYDVIVCNPPYVTSATMRKLPREYRYEPRIALAGGPDGLDAARRILREAAAHLVPSGMMVMEVGNGRRRLERAFPTAAFTWIETAGGGDVLVAQRAQLAERAVTGPA